MRAAWVRLTDEQLLAQCEVDTYRASGPGGQKRNKTSSAVRLRHPPSGLLTIAEESRSQHENRARALRRLRRALFLKLREPVPAPALEAAAPPPPADFAAVTAPDGRVHVRPKDPRYWPAVGAALDVLEAVEARVAEAAGRLGVSTAQFVEFLHGDPKVWEAANQMRARFGHKLLRGD